MSYMKTILSNYPFNLSYNILATVYSEVEAGDIALTTFVPGITEGLKELTEDEAEVLKYRYFNEHTYAMIGILMNQTKDQIKAIEKMAVEKMLDHRYKWLGVPLKKVENIRGSAIKGFLVQIENVFEEFEDTELDKKYSTKKRGATK